MKLIPQTAKWVKPFDVGFVLVAFASGLVFGVLAFHAQVFTRGDNRPIISNHATMEQVIANLDGKHPLATGQYLQGFQCAAWSAGSKKTHHGWVVEFCVK